MAIISGIKIFGSGAKPPVLEELNATSNGTYTPSDGVDGFSPVEVNVQPLLQTKAIEITANGQSTIEADSGYYGLESVGVNVNVQPKLQAKSTSTTITENGTSTITLEPDSNYDGLSSANVTITTNVTASMPNLQSKSIEIVKNGTQTIGADEGYDGLSSVEVRSNVPQQSTKLIVPDGMKLGYSSNIPFDLLDFSQVTNMDNMFYHCINLTPLDLSNFNTSEVTSMASMLEGAFSSFLIEETHLDLSGWNTSKVTNMDGMFKSCISLTSLDVSNFNTSQVTNMSSMFSGCSGLISLDLSNFNTSQVTKMSSMFNGCSGLTSLDLSNFDTSAVKSMIYMFSNCKTITSLDLSNWVISEWTSIGWMFQKCISLTNLNMTNAILPKMNLTNWYLNSCPLTVDSLVSVLNALPQLDEGQSFTCSIGSDNLAKLSDEQKSIATNKGWTLN